MAVPITTIMTDGAALLRLLAWTSPAFPIGAFAFSHGLEAAVEDGLVKDAASLHRYVMAVCADGSGFVDAVLLVHAHAGTTDLAELIDLAQALRGTAELALEAGVQGSAALRTLRLAWPHPALERLHALAAELAVDPALPIVLGVAGRAHGVPLDLLVLATLAGFAANLVSAGVRLVPLGQTDGQRVTAMLEADLPGIAARALTTPIDELGTSALIVDFLSIAHETQYTRLFRS